MDDRRFAAAVGGAVLADGPFGPWQDPEHPGAATADGDAGEDGPGSRAAARSRVARFLAVRGDGESADLVEHRAGLNPGPLAGTFEAVVGDLYHDLAKLGFDPPRVDEWTWGQLLMVLGQHRHPDWWPKPEPVKTKGRKGRKGPPVRSERDRDPSRLRASSRDLFAQRRAAAARGETLTSHGPAMRPSAGTEDLLRELYR